MRTTCDDRGGCGGGRRSTVGRYLVLSFVVLVTRWQLAQSAVSRCQLERITESDVLMIPIYNYGYT